MTGDELHRIVEEWKASETEFVDTINEKFRRYDVMITSILNVLFANKITAPEDFQKMIVKNSALVDQAAAYFRDKKDDS